jgi:hypothetical protein
LTIDIGIDPEMVADCIGYLSRYSTNRGFYSIPRDQNEAATETTPRIWAFLGLIRQRHLIHESQGRLAEQPCLLDTMALARRTNATDLRDKIFGLLGVSSDGPDLYHLVSYSRSAEKVYQDFARSFVNSGQGIAMLYQIESRTSKTLEIPTWVPVSILLCSTKIRS